MSLGRRVVAELVGTMLLVAAVVGSGIMGERLAGGNIAVALFANTVPVGAVLAALIVALGPVSGAHLNPAVSVADAWQGGIRWREVPAYIAAQVSGACAGVVVAHWMFGLAVLSSYGKARTGTAQVFSEFVATFGLFCVIWGCARSRQVADGWASLAWAVGAYIVGASWFTASYCFANPAVTLARGLTGTFAGIRMVDVPAFAGAQFAGAAAATWLCGWLMPRERDGV